MRDVLARCLLSHPRDYLRYNSESAHRFVGEEFRACYALTGPVSNATARGRGRSCVVQFDHTRFH